MTPAPVVITDLGDLARHVVSRFDSLEALIMATKAELEAAQAAQSAAFADYSADVTARLQELAAAQAAMQQTLDAAVGNDAEQNALIADLQGQLAAMAQTTDEVVTRANALTDAIKAADVAVDRPETPAP